MSGNLRERGQVREAELLRGDDAADGVAARQDDAAMIHCLGRILRGVVGQRGTLDEGPAASWTPVGF